MSAADQTNMLTVAYLVQDVLALVDVEGRREPGRAPELSVGGFDLIWDGGPVSRFAMPTSLPTLLGCYNPRDKTQARSSKSRTDLEGKFSGGLDFASF